MYYAGIGSRRTPRDIQRVMSAYAQDFAAARWTLRSGGAAGADQAFEDGAHEDDRMEIFVPWASFGRGKKSYRVLRGITAERAILLASVVHPRWDLCDSAARLLHARNVAQIWGEDLNTPVAFVLFWAPETNGIVDGGTSTAVAIARQAGIETFNLAVSGTLERFEDFLTALGDIAA